MLDANARGHKLIIMDARPKINAVANQVYSLSFCYGLKAVHNLIDHSFPKVKESKGKELGQKSSSQE